MTRARWGERRGRDTDTDTDTDERTGSLVSSSSWRRRAGQLFRAVHRDIEPVLQRHNTIYHVFGELVPLCVKAHEDRNIDDLGAIYGFVHWCWDADQEVDEDLGNAVGVAFLEHLGHSAAVREQIGHWLRPELLDATLGLWSWQLTPEELAEVSRQEA